MKKHIAIFASGSGTNAEAIIKYFRDTYHGAEVALVICNRREAGVYERAERLGVPILYLPREDFRNPAILLPLLEEAGIEGVVLAGFLLMIPDFLLEKYPGKIINIHPSLLPKYGGKGMYGMHVHEAVVAAGERETGITIHRVSPECDGGEILFQASVALSPADTPEDVAAKVHALEYAHYPEVIARTLL